MSVTVNGMIVNAETDVKAGKHIHSEFLAEYSMFLKTWL